MVCFGGEKVNEFDEFDKLEIKCYLPEIPGKSRFDKIILIKWNSFIIIDLSYLLFTSIIIENINNAVDEIS